MRCALLLPLSACLLVPACKPGPVGDKAAADNKAFQDDDGGFFGAFLGPRKKPAASDPGVPGVCRFSAWAAATEPTAIRSGPGKTFDVLGTLPASRPTQAGLTGVEAATFQVVEAQRGWFRIENASYQRLDFDENPVVYPPGWIPGKAISFALQSDFAYAMPDAKSPVVASSWNDPAGTQPMHFEAPLFCQGDWVLLTVAGYDGKKKPAWLRGACGTLETRCDDIASDNPAKPADLPTYAVPAPAVSASDPARPSPAKPASASSTPAAD